MKLFIIFFRKYSDLENNNYLHIGEEIFIFPRNNSYSKNINFFTDEEIIYDNIP